MSIPEYYNVCGVGVRAHIPRRGLLAAYENPLSAFATRDNLEADITVHLGPFEPNLRSTVNVDHEFWVKDNWIYLRRHSPAGTINAEISGFVSGPTVIRANIELNPKYRALFYVYPILDAIVKPLLAQHLERRNSWLLHGAGFSIGGRTGVVVGRGGAGKTSLVMHAAKRYMSPIYGDDMIILQDRQLHAFPWLQSILVQKLKLQAAEDPTTLGERASATRSWFKEERGTVPPLARIDRISMIQPRVSGITSSEQVEDLDVARFALATTELEWNASPVLGTARLGVMADARLAYAYVLGMPADRGTRTAALAGALRNLQTRRLTVPYPHDQWTTETKDTILAVAVGS